ncbi:NUDIX hydrolase [Nonlabens spongiae]|uniref:NUDIX hydrolase n=1 Tax=Nonlabens spongiae TaxID=331648 RepID=A0A1W6MP67_9FLAO|nr:NUDIX domain-containing protein [Nonlabens spongiae]ARN79413.1 NUDIX hydrolase [Nonlabens spongiae]
MYKVFVKEVPIILTSDKTAFPDHKILKIKNVDLKKIVKQIQKGKLNKVALYSRNPKKLLPRFHKLLPVVTAAGGLVTNADNDFLFIHRNGKWDLPKGKVEKKESLEDGAIREVEEETGVKNLTIEGYLGHTYHIFSWKSDMRIKLTHWYIMKTDYDGELHPQVKEGIDKAVWLSKDMMSLALEKSYANIRQLFPD